MLDRLRERLRAEPPVAFAYLFGSRAKGHARPDSDWDVAVFVDERLDDDERFKLTRRLAGDLAELGAVDLVVLNEAPALLGHRALQGERLFVRDMAAFVRFFVKTLVFDRVLEKEGVLTAETSRRMQGWAGLRNLLVHAYLQVDHERLHGFLATEIEDLATFAREVGDATRTD